MHHSAVSEKRSVISDTIGHLRKKLDEYEQILYQQLDQFEHSNLEHFSNCQSNLEAIQKKLSENREKLDHLVPWTNAKIAMDHYNAIEEEITRIDEKCMNQNIPITKLCSIDTICSLPDTIGNILMATNVSNKLGNVSTS